MVTVAASKVSGAEQPVAHVHPVGGVPLELDATALLDGAGALLDTAILEDTGTLDDIAMLDEMVTLEDIAMLEETFILDETATALDDISAFELDDKVAGLLLELCIAVELIITEPEDERVVPDESGTEPEERGDAPDDAPEDSASELEDVAVAEEPAGPSEVAIPN